MEQAKDRIKEAQKSFADIKKRIALDHGIVTESWMEWETYVKFDGDFILFYYDNKIVQLKSDWIQIPPGQYLKTKDTPVPKNYHDWHLEETR